MKSILVVGLGRFGRHMAMKLIEQGNEVFAIDKNEDRVNFVLPIIRNVQIGDATNELYMDSIGVNNFDLCVIAIGDDFQSALEATVLIKDLGGKHILARAGSDVHKKLLLRNGADYVVYVEREIAERLALKYGARQIFDYVELTPEYSIYEIAVPSIWRGKSIVDKEVRTKYHISILATKKDGKIHPLPRPEHIFTSDETLIIMGHNEDVNALVH